MTIVTRHMPSLAVIVAFAIPAVALAPRSHLALAPHFFQEWNERVRGRELELRCGTSNTSEMGEKVRELKKRQAEIERQIQHLKRVKSRTSGVESARN